MFDYDTTRCLGAGECPAPLTLGDLIDRIERRLAWYGLPQSGVRAIEMCDGSLVEVTVTVGGNGTFREVFDRRTGGIRWRERLDG